MGCKLMGSHTSPSNDFQNMIWGGNDIVPSFQKLKKMEITTPFCAQLGCEYPIIQAISNNKSSASIAQEIKQVKEQCKGKSFGVEFCDFDGSLVTVLPEWVDLLAQAQVKVLVVSSTADKATVVSKAQKHKMLVGAAVHTTTEAKALVNGLGLDFVIARGAEAGGAAGEVFTSVLLPQIVNAVSVPVVAAGGIFDGRGLASALCFGAQAVWVGTRFLLTNESKAVAEYKSKLLACTSDDMVLSRCYSSLTSPCCVLRNAYTDLYQAKPTSVEATVEQVKQRCVADGVWALVQGKPVANPGNQAIPAGQSAGAISTLLPAAEVVREMVAVAAATLTLVNSKYATTGGDVHTPFCDLLGVKNCVMSAGMGGIAGKDMTAIVSRAGGFGTFGSALNVANMTPAELLADIQSLNKMCNGTPFGVDILVHGSDGGVMIELIDAFAKGGAKVFVSGKGNPSPRVIGLFHDRNMLVGSICGKLAHAKGAVASGVDFVIVQGAEGGGHTGQVALSALLPQVVDAVGHKVPVIAAGGVYDGRGLASALCYGAQGVWVGTRFMMSPEAQTSDGYKAELLKHESESTLVTKAYTGATMRVIRNPYVGKFADHPELLEENLAMCSRRAWNDGCWKLHSGAGVGDPKVFELSNQALVTGQNIGAIETLVPCADIVQEMNSTCWRVLRTLSSQVKPRKQQAKL
ncbi:hypothetical protein BASA81_001969 [Batrachochytrium salamandrivorans]|nr:hypothetical protein BASA81_001969 [Batrachochytrium salamandrivorans]